METVGNKVEIIRHKAKAFSFVGLNSEFDDLDIRGDFNEKVNSMREYWNRVESELNLVKEMYNVLGGQFRLATESNSNCEYCYQNSERHINIYFYVLETDKELAVRLKIEKDEEQTEKLKMKLAEEKNKEKELKLLKRLKQKYESKA